MLVVSLFMYLDLLTGAWSGTLLRLSVPFWEQRKFEKDLRLVSLMLP